MLTTLVFLAVCTPPIVLIWAGTAYIIWDGYQDFQRRRRGG